MSFGKNMDNFKLERSKILPLSRLNTELDALCVKTACAHCTQHDERRNHLWNEASTRARPCPACEQRGPGRPAAAKRGELTMKSSSCWSSEPSGACGIESSSGE